MENTQPQITQATISDSKGTKFLAGVGIVALIIAAVWLGVQAVQFGGNITSNLASTLSGVRLFFGGTNDIVLTASPSIVAPDGNTTLAWEYEPETEGVYKLSYSCTDGVHFTSPLSTNTGNVLFCNTPFEVADTESELILTAVSINDEPTNIAFRLMFESTEENEVVAEGGTTITVALTEDTEGDTTEEDETDTTSEETTTPATTPAPAPAPAPVPVTTVTNDPNGTPDLTVEILEVGTITESGNFTASTGPLDPDDQLAVRFVIENVGTKDTGTWSFEADLPTERSYTWESDNQETLFPGVRAEYFLGFEDAEDDEDELSLTIRVDHENDVDESNENNNSDTITFPIED